MVSHYDRAAVPALHALSPPSSTRLAPPASERVVARPRLLRRLSSALDAQVVLVQAPAGYGKSTLLAQFAAVSKRPVAWLSLDARDDDPITLLHDLVCALTQFGPVDELLAELGAEPSTVLTSAIPRVLAWIEALEVPLVFVLDDVHHVQRPAALDILAVLCAEAPGGMSVVLASRTRPQMPFARLKAEGRLWELSAQDLRMTPVEGTAMLQAAGAQVDPAEGALVVDRTEGWPAAIYLAALMLREGGDPIPLGPSREDLRAYFREEVLDAAAPDDAEFLLRCSILDELDPAVCNRLLDRADADERLRELAAVGLFVTPVDQRSGVYRIHPLFREILTAKLTARPGEDLAELHGRASEAYTDQGDPERAIRHALDGGDVERAANLCWAVTPALSTHGQRATLRRWAGWFTEEQLAAHPQAALGAGFAALNEGDGATVAHYAAMVLRADPARRLPDDIQVVALGHILRASLGERGLTQIARDAQAALEGIPEGHPISAIPRYLLGGVAMLRGDREEAQRSFERAETLTAGVLPGPYTLALAQQAVLAIDDGDWDVARALTHRAAMYQRSARVDEYATQAIVVAVRALVEAHEGEHVKGRETAEHAARNLALMGSTGPWQALETRLVLSCAFAALEQRGRARALLAEARDLLRPDTGPFLLAWEARARDALQTLRGDADGVGLTTAELRTLQYLPTHLSLREVGERLVVSRNTVKTHTVSIYRKLGVSTRSEAVRRARELGLIDG